MASYLFLVLAFEVIQDLATIVYFKRLDSRLFAIHFTSFSVSFWTQLENWKRAYVVFENIFFGIFHVEKF